MLTHTTTYRIIYGDTDRMGVVYYGNYLRFFEMGRGEMFRDLGLTYRELEETGVILPVREATCFYHAPLTYDDLITIETTLDTSVKAALRFTYTIFKQDGTRVATGHTVHACVDARGRVVRPPKALTRTIEKARDAIRT